MPRVLAVDWGERRVGLALSDPGGIIATGLDTLLVGNPDQAVAGVIEVARREEVERIVVGLPLLMSGERGEAAEAAQKFADRIAQESGIPVETYDERLTSALSARRLREVGVRTGHRKDRVDQGAAVALLESYLLRIQSRLVPPGDAGA